VIASNRTFRSPYDSQTGKPIVVGIPVPPPVPEKTSRKAVASLVLGILGLLTAFLLIGVLFGIIGLILGIKALGQIQRSMGKLGGKGIATAGVVCSGIAVSLLVLAPVVAAISIPSFVQYKQKAEEAKARAAQKEQELYNGAEKLLTVEKGLTDDSDVTFYFSDTSSTGNSAENK
jgi:Domain of unknown function (DUF4190)